MVRSKNEWSAKVMTVLKAGNTAAAIAQMYTEDGALMPPNAPISKGKAAIEQAWAGMMSAPGFEYVEPSAWLTTATQPTAPDAHKAPNKPDTSGRR